MKARIDNIIGRILVILMAVITLDVLWGVVTRYFLGGQASWSEELARFLLIWIGILGAAYVAGQREHLSINLLETKLDMSGRRKLTTLISMCIIFFAVAVLLVGGFRLIYLTYVLGQASPALRVPMSLIYSVVPLSGVLIIFYELNFLKSH